MITPIVDFVKKYSKSPKIRLHMPGHKGISFLGCENFDITEVSGADSLYEADGIIHQSEQNATQLFSTGRTIFSTEGSSQCIKAMLYLAGCYCNNEAGKRKYVITTRNAHKSFLYAAALLDFDVEWIFPLNSNSICSCQITQTDVENIIQKKGYSPIGVYLTSPDYLGVIADIKQVAKICKKFGTLLLVDNAHGAYLNFLKENIHPISQGADICCDSAHKTLPVLTGGAYLHISKNVSKSIQDSAKQAMALFGSTSPSYLILASLDMCNDYLSRDYVFALEESIKNIEEIRFKLKNNGWIIKNGEPLKITVVMPESVKGYEMAQKLRENNIECEYSDNNYLVFMVTPQNTKEQLNKLVDVMGKNKFSYVEQKDIKITKMEVKMSIRQAMFSPQETILAENSLGKICGTPTVACPPAIPIAVCGEVIDKNAIELFKHYNIKEISVVK